MLTRRSLLTAAAPLAFAGLAGCSSDFGDKLNAAVDQVYVTDRKAAQKLEDAIAVARKDINAAIEFLKPFARPVAQICVMLGGFIRRLIAAGALNGSTQTVMMALSEADKLAASPLILGLANGVVPTDIAGVLTMIIQATMLIMDLTQYRATPTAAVAAHA